MQRRAPRRHGHVSCDEPLDHNRPGEYPVSAAWFAVMRALYAGSSRAGGSEREEPYKLTDIRRFHRMLVYTRAFGTSFGLELRWACRRYRMRPRE